MGRKTVSYNKTGVGRLPDDKPVVYRIQTASGKTNYVGVAQRGRVQERILEHLGDGDIPGDRVQIDQMSRIQEAKAVENRVIARTQPKYNEQGK